ncbi:MAG: stage II sporulation protein M [Nannocystaceae bacterium]
MKRHTQDEFVQAHEARWRHLETLLEQEQSLYQHPAAEISRFAEDYRVVCGHLMYARSTGFGSELVSYLDGLAARAHNVLYGARPFRMGALWALVGRRFPRALRRRWRAFGISNLLFYGPFFAALLLTLQSPGFAAEVLPKSMLEGMADMYSTSHTGREIGTDAAMAGHYIYNNIGIAFRCFATGILLGLGSMFFLVYNGLIIGTVVGYVIYRGHGENILTFVCGHGSFELTGIVISGAAGMVMGYALVDTGGRSRLESLRACGPDVGAMISGAGLMLLIAAFIEGFWSPSGIAPPIKWSVAAGLWLAVAVYLVIAGRGARRVKP